MSHVLGGFVLSNNSLYVSISQAWHNLSIFPVVTCRMKFGGGANILTRTTFSRREFIDCETFRTMLSERTQRVSKTRRSMSEQEDLEEFLLTRNSQRDTLHSSFVWPIRHRPV